MRAIRLETGYARSVDLFKSRNMDTVQQHLSPVIRVDDMYSPVPKTQRSVTYSATCASVLEKICRSLRAKTDLSHLVSEHELLEQGLRGIRLSPGPILIGQLKSALETLDRLPSYTCPYGFVYAYGLQCDCDCEARYSMPRRYYPARAETSV